MFKISWIFIFKPKRNIMKYTVTIKTINNKGKEEIDYRRKSNNSTIFFITKYEWISHTTLKCSSFLPSRMCTAPVIVLTVNWLEHGNLTTKRQ